MYRARIGHFTRTEIISSLDENINPEHKINTAIAQAARQRVSAVRPQSESSDRRRSSFGAVRPSGLEAKGFARLAGFSNPRAE